MAVKSTLDPEIKLELLIKLAFQIPTEWLAKEYGLSKNKIINLRKNNYKIYNEFFDHWKIDKSVAILGLSPKYERALSVVKKFYKDKIEIESSSSIRYKGKLIGMHEILDLADLVLQKDNIYCLRELSADIKNYY